MKYADRLKFSATGTSAATITVGAAIAGFRTPAQCIADGALIVGDTGVMFTTVDTSGNWEQSAHTITSATVLTRTAVLASSVGGTNPAVFSGPLTVYNAPPASFLSSLLTSTQAVAASGLTGANALAGTDIFLVSQDGGTSIGTTTLTAIAAAVAAINGNATPVETLTVNNPGTKTAGTAFTVSGTYTNGPPSALDWSINGGSSWTQATSTIGSGVYSFGGVTVPGANASQTVMVRDRVNTSVTATSSAFVVSASAVETLTVATPVTQTVGTPFNVTGTYANGTPTALDYQLSDGGGAWVQVTSATIGSGTFSFSVTPATASAGRTITVRDRNNTSAVSAPSGTYVVNASGGGGSYDTLTGLAQVTASGSNPTTYTSTDPLANYNDFAGGWWSKHFAANTDGKLSLVLTTSGTFNLELFSSNAANNVNDASAVFGVTPAYGTAYGYYFNMSNSGVGTVGAQDGSIHFTVGDTLELERINSAGGGNTSTLIARVLRAGVPSEIGRVTSFPAGVLYPRWVVQVNAACTSLQSTGLV